MGNNNSRTLLDHQKEIIKDRLAKREIWINGEINENLIYDAIMWIHKWNEEDELKQKYTPIRVFINSIGGSSAESYSLIQALINSLADVYTYNVGKCLSAGFNIFLAGEKRYCHENSHFMMHGPSVGSSQKKIHDMASAVERFKEDEKFSVDWIYNRTKMKKGDIKEMLNTDVWMTGREAFKNGVATNIISIIRNER